MSKRNPTQKVQRKSDKTCEKKVWTTEYLELDAEKTAKRLEEKSAEPVKTDAVVEDATKKDAEPVKTESETQKMDKNDKKRANKSMDFGKKSGKKDSGPKNDKKDKKPKKDKK
jgi:hypothetical protein